MATPHPYPTAPSSPQASPAKPKALIVISSARTLPLAQPSGHPGISTGFFLVEMAKVLQAFGDDYDLFFATPDGRPPQLDINGMALSFHAVPGYQLLGRLPVSRPLPTPTRKPSSSVTTSSERSRPCPSTPITRRGSWWNATATPRTRSSCVTRVRPHARRARPDDRLRRQPLPGRAAQTLYEDGVLISLICHAPVAMVSAKYRVAADGEISITSDHHFKSARLTAVPKHAELVALTTAYPKVPDHKIRLTYYVDEALKDAGYQVETATNPAAVRVVYDEKANLLTGNGPQAIDDQAATLRQLLDGATPHGRPATTRTPA